MRSLIFIISLLFCSYLIYSQTPKEDNIWKSLAKISYKKEYDELMGFKVEKPVFSESVKALENKEFTIKGYIIPIEGYKSHKEFIFSAYHIVCVFFAAELDLKP